MSVLNSTNAFRTNHQDDQPLRPTAQRVPLAKIALLGKCREVPGKPLAMITKMEEQADKICQLIDPQNFSKIGTSMMVGDEDIAVDDPRNKDDMVAIDSPKNLTTEKGLEKVLNRVHSATGDAREKAIEEAEEFISKISPKGREEFELLIDVKRAIANCRLSLEEEKAPIKDTQEDKTSLYDMVCKIQGRPPEDSARLVSP